TTTTMPYSNPIATCPARSGRQLNAIISTINCLSTLASSRTRSQPPMTTRHFSAPHRSISPGKRAIARQRTATARTSMAVLLIDEGSGVDIALRLRTQGLQTFHALEFLPKGASDALVFQLAQTRSLTVFTWNRDHFVLLAEAWNHWGHGAHFGVIA